MMPRAITVAAKRGGRRFARAVRSSRLVRSGCISWLGGASSRRLRPSAPSAAPGEEQRQEEEREAEAARDEERQRRDQQAEADEHEGALTHATSVTFRARRRKPPPSGWCAAVHL